MPKTFRPKTKPLGEFIKDITGQKPPTHALTLKNAFGAYVRSGLIAETDYDANSNNCLEIAAHIVKAVSKGADAPLAHDAFGKLPTNSRNAAKRKPRTSVRSSLPSNRSQP